MLRHTEEHGIEVARQECAGVYYFGQDGAGDKHFWSQPERTIVVVEMEGGEPQEPAKAYPLEEAKSVTDLLDWAIYIFHKRGQWKECKLASIHDAKQRKCKARRRGL